MFNNNKTNIVHGLNLVQTLSVFNLPKGESSREKVRWQILKLLLNGPATSPEIVETCDAAKATVYKYLNELYEESKVIWKPQRGRGKSTYELTNEMKDEIEKKLLKDDLYDLTESFDVKWLRMLRNLLSNMRKDGIDPYTYFQSNCLTFVGGIPRTFPKSKENMQAIIDWENALETRARQEGITKEEYWRKKLKEAEKLTGVPRILTSLGFTKEEIEELRKRQGGTFKVTRYTKKRAAKKRVKEKEKRRRAREQEKKELPEKELTWHELIYGTK